MFDGLLEAEVSTLKVMDLCLVCVDVAGPAVLAGVLPLAFSTNGESGSDWSRVTALRPFSSMDVITGSITGYVTTALLPGANISNRLKRSNAREKSMVPTSIPKRRAKQIGHMVGMFHHRRSRCCMTTFPPVLSTNFCT